MNVPGSEMTDTRGGLHNSVTRAMLKPTHMIGGYVQQAYGLYDWAQADENIAAGFRTLAEAMQAWIDSPSHCKALMRGDIREVGLAVVPGAAQSKYGSYWTMALSTAR